MKKIIVSLVALCAVAVAGYAAAGPFLTIYRIKTAIEGQDHGRLARLVDFPALRTDLKAQLAARAAKEAAGLKGSLFASVAAGVSAKMAGGLVDSLVTPEGVTGLVGILMAGETQAPASSPGALQPQPAAGPEGRGPEAAAGGPEPKESPKPRPTLLSDARYAYEGLGRFSVGITDGGREFRFVLIRDGLSWRLTQVILPADF